MADITIRKILRTDIPGLANLYQNFWGEESNIELMNLKYSELVDNPKYIILSAIADGELAGSITEIICDELYGQCNPFLVMEDLIVDPSYRRKGIGKLLLAELEVSARNSGCSQILFITEADRTDAISFYESVGFDSKAHIGFKKKL